jgi:general secretion pathway protein D
MGGMGGYGGGMGGYGGMGGMGGMYGGTGAGQYIAEDLRVLVEDSTGWENWADVSETGEGGTITPYPSQQPKKLAVLATHEVHSQIESLLAALRKALGYQVSIEARFLVVSENFLEDVGLDVDFTVNLGTKWGQITIQQGSALATTPDPSTKVQGSLGGITPSASVAGGYGNILDDLQVAFLLRATQAHTDAKALIEPKVSVLSGESASFSVQDMVSYALPPNLQTGTQTGLGGTTFQQGQQQQVGFMNVGSSLTITPIISNDKKNVLLNIQTQLTDLLRLRTHHIEAPLGAIDPNVVPYDVTVPETETSLVMTRVSVPDGGTLLLGGQKITAEVEKESGVPILSKIPIIGRLFGNRSVIKDHKILLILVKPTIMLQEEREAEAIAALESPS